MTRHRVLLTDYAWPDTQIERHVLEAADCELIAAQATDADEVAILSREHRPSAIMTCWAPVTAKAITASPDLRHVARMGIGLDNIDVETCTRRGIWVSNVPDYCVEEVSDHAIGCLLAWARSLTPFDRQVRAGKWDPTAFPLRRVSELTVGIVGFGRIGQLTARKLRGFGCRVLAHSRGKLTDLPPQVSAMDLETLLRTSDVVILHIPLTPESQHLMNEERIGSMKRGSLLINVSRGGVVDTEALAAALLDGHLEAALDVVEGEPSMPASLRASQDRLLCTPHVAFSSGTSVAELRRRAAGEVLQVLQDGRPRHPCNRPESS